MRWRDVDGDTAADPGRRQAGDARALRLGRLPRWSTCSTAAACRSRLRAGDRAVKLDRRTALAGLAGGLALPRRGRLRDAGAADAGAGLRPPRRHAAAARRRALSRRRRQHVVRRLARRRCGVRRPRPARPRARPAQGARPQQPADHGRGRGRPAQELDQAGLLARPTARSTRSCSAGSTSRMAEIAKRGMTAVVCLGNFWEWSGGFGTWLYRVTGALHGHERSGASVAGLSRRDQPFYANARGGRALSRACPRDRHPHQCDHRPALRRRSGDHELAARQRAAPRRQRRRRSRATATPTMPGSTAPPR